ncbi:hypothetical protein [Paenibacillus macquariensis]|uniref:Uncharacterized protein n=1 Tax=Paenibacillus macquariensis TaxID=948756 RepID=A0ABY1JS70_9BACL|nr:hypothetical protein [Paenibacillus macquariensis]OAB36246.1 hypothetical protein PMSM_07295 [Paenibacillus macquariensis subsp. macquariensis]SIQ67867.1 hypothetical protein SAMN05421578_103324 [Paenibacillus macquariensis]
MYKKTVNSRMELNKVLDALDVIEKDYTIVKVTDKEADVRRGDYPYSWIVEEVDPEASDNKSWSVGDMHVNLTFNSDPSSLEEVKTKIQEVLSRHLSNFVSLDLSSDA